MKKYLITITILLGCSSFNEEGRMVDIVYTKDRRTNLCFASMYPTSTQYVLTNVPCTPEVERLVR